MSSSQTYQIPEMPASQRVSATIQLVFVAGILLGVKLMLVAGREMIVMAFDSVEYVTTSIYYLSLSDGHSHPPGASYLIWLGRHTGIPFRVFQELLLGLAAFLFLRPLVVSELSLGMASAAYALILFNPNLIKWMDYSLSDPSNLFLLLAGFGGVLGTVVAPRQRFPAGSLVLILTAFGFVGITRDEVPIVCAVMAAAIAFSLTLFSRADRWRARRAVLACGCAAAATLLANQGLSAAAYLNQGYWGSSPVQSREWWRLYSTLLALPADRTYRYDFVNGQVIGLAAELSPTFAELSPCLTRGREEGLASLLASWNAFVQWKMLTCAGENEIAKLNAMTAEIRNAAQLRRIELSWPLLGMIPTPTSRWLAYLPRSLIEVLNSTTSNPPSLKAELVQYREFLPVGAEALFNRALLRRASLAQNQANPELLLYKNFLSGIYRILSLGGVAATGAVLFYVLGYTSVRSIRLAPTIVTFFLALVSFDVACRVSFYTVVDWLFWPIYGAESNRYTLFSQVTLSVQFVLIVALVVQFILKRSLRKNGEVGLSTAVSADNSSRA